MLKKYYGETDYIILLTNNPDNDAVGSVDNGKADITDIVTAFERTFHIDLGDVYHIFIAFSICGKKIRNKES